MYQNINNVYLIKNILDETMNVIDGENLKSLARLVWREKMVSIGPQYEWDKSAMTGF